MRYGQSLKIAEPATSDGLVDDYLDAAKSTVREMKYPLRRESLRKRSTDIKHTDLVDLLKHQRQLFWGLGVLTTKAEAVKAGHEKAYNAVWQSIGVLEDAIIDALEWDPIATAPTPTSAKKAQEVFEIPELAEMILWELSVEELLPAMSVNKALHACITSSKKVKQRLGLLPDWQTFWHSNFHHLHDDRNTGRPMSKLYCHILKTYTEDPKQRLDVNEVSVEWGESYGTRYSPEHLTLGPTSRAMLICQPPIKEMHVHTNCCHPPPDPYDRHGSPRRSDAGLPLAPPMRVLRFEKGITVGDVLDATLRAQKEHAHCPYAATYLHNATTGLVNVRVVLRGHQKLIEGDPSRLKYHKRSNGSDSGDEGRHHVYHNKSHAASPMTGYVEAKKLALRKGEPVPSFEEFQKTGVEWFYDCENCDYCYGGCDRCLRPRDEVEGARSDDEGDDEGDDENGGENEDGP